MVSLSCECEDASHVLQCSVVITRQFFLQNTHNRHPIARPCWRDMGCLLRVQALINVLPRSLQWCMKYHVVLDHVITTLDCIFNRGRQLADSSITNITTIMIKEEQLWPDMIAHYIYIYTYRWENVISTPSNAHSVIISKRNQLALDVVVPCIIWSVLSESLTANIFRLNRHINSAQSYTISNLLQTNGFALLIS